MEAATPPAAARSQRRAQEVTPLGGGSGAKRMPLSTPRSVLTPNDDAAEKAASRKRRQAECMRRSLAGAFAAPWKGGEGDGDGGCDSGGAGRRPACGLSEEELRVMLDLALKLAAENKITDRNVWALPLIDHLPDMVQHAAPDASGEGCGDGGGAGGNYFTRISGGLDAGVQIYSKRVDATWKLALKQLFGAPQVEGGSQDPDGSQDRGDGGGDAKRRRRGGAELQEADTLAEAAQLRVKQLDSSFLVDPLFHHTSQLFDEDGVQGMLLLNRSVCSGSIIMFEPGGVLEDHFHLPGAAAAQGEGDVAVNLQALRPLLQSLQRQCAANGTVPPGSVAAIAPATRQLHVLLQAHGLEGDVDEAAVEAEVADIMAAVEGDCARFAAANRACAPAPRQPGMSGAAAGGPASGQEAGERMHCAAVADCGAGSGDAAMQDVGEDGCGGRAATSDGGIYEDGMGDADCDAPEWAPGDEPAPAEAGAHWQDTQRLESEAGARLAELYTQQPNCEEDAGAFGGADDGDWGADDDCDSDGGGDAGDAERMRGADTGPAARHAFAALLDVESMDGDGSLRRLLGGGDSSAGIRRGACWAGTSYWRFQKAPGGGKPAQKDSATTNRRGRRPADTFVDFESPPPLLAGALEPGTLRQTTLATCAQAATLLPEDHRYDVAELARLFLKPHAVIGAAGPRPPAGNENGDAWRHIAAAALDDAAPCGGGGSGGFLDDSGAAGNYADGGGYSDYAGGYDGDDAHSSGLDASGQGLDEDAEQELLRAPRRVACMGVSYNRASKQIDVHALKDIIWSGVVGAAAGGGDGASGAADSTSGGGGGGGGVDFRDVIKSIPKDSPAGRLEDMSTAMCFICLLHLANQHGLRVIGGDDLATLEIQGAAAAAAAADGPGHAGE